MYNVQYTEYSTSYGVIFWLHTLEYTRIYLYLFCIPPPPNMVGPCLSLHTGVWQTAGVFPFILSYYSNIYIYIYRAAPLHITA